MSSFIFIFYKDLPHLNNAREATAELHLIERSLIEGLYTINHSHSLIGNSPYITVILRLPFELASRICLLFGGRPAY